MTVHYPQLAAPDVLTALLNDGVRVDADVGADQAAEAGRIQGGAGAEDAPGGRAAGRGVAGRQVKRVGVGGLVGEPVLDRLGERELGQGRAEPRLQRPVDVQMLGKNVETAAIRQHIGAAGDAVDRHRITRGDRQHGLQPGIEEPPVTGLGARPQYVMLRHRHSPRLWIDGSGNFAAKRAAPAPEDNDRIPLFDAEKQQKTPVQAHSRRNPVLQVVDSARIRREFRYGAEQRKFGGRSGELNDLTDELQRNLPVLRAGAARWPACERY